MRCLAVFAFCACLLPASAPAQDDCPLEGPGTCHSAFREFSAAVADGPRRLVAVGRLRAPSAPGFDAAVVSIEPEGAIVVIEPPSDAGPGNGRPLSFVEGRDIIRIADGEFVVFGVAVYGEGNASTYAGWSARVGLDGRTRWSRTYPGPNETHHLFHFGIGLSDGRLLAGGRRQQGQDPDSTCSVWSQTLLALINPDTGELLQNELVDGSRDHRRAFYSAAEVVGQGYVFTGFATAPKQDSPGKCQDDLLFVWTDMALEPLNQQQVGHPVANDLGLDLAFHDNALLSAGTTSLETPVAFVDAFRVEGGVPLSFRRGAGESGRDVFTVVARHPLAQDYIAAGSWSESANGWYKAWWFRLDQDLSPIEEVSYQRLPRICDQWPRHSRRRQDDRSRLCPTRGGRFLDTIRLVGGH